MILDGVLACLLLLTVIFCWRLNKKIAQVDNARQELSKFVLKFDKTIGQAEKLLSDLRSVDINSEALRRQLKECRDMADELIFVRDTSSRIADRLELAVSAIRPEPYSGVQVNNKPAAAEPQRSSSPFSNLSSRFMGNTKPAAVQPERSQKGSVIASLMAQIMEKEEA